VTKYGNRKVVLDGYTFDSVKEANRYGELCLLQRAGQIGALRRQVPYRLEVAGKLICKLIVDFDYFENGKVVCEDVKSDFTRKLPVWRIKSKLFEALNGFPIREV
jgi:hypothetical protein